MCEATCTIGNASKTRCFRARCELSRAPYPVQRNARGETRSVERRQGVSTCIVLLVGLVPGGPRFRRGRSLGPARAVRDAVARLPLGHEGAGRVSSAVGSACAGLRQLLRVFTRPVIGRFPRLGLRSSRAHQAACAPGALAPSPRRRFHRAGRLSDALPGPSGFMSPEAMRLEVRFASQPGAGLRGLTRWATLQSQLASSPALERSSPCPDASNATPTNARPS